VSADCQRKEAHLKFEDMLEEEELSEDERDEVLGLIAVLTSPTLDGDDEVRAGQTLKEKYPAAARIAENVLTPLVTTAVKMRLGWGG
jgi:hypothetical protein